MGSPHAFEHRRTELAAIKVYRKRRRRRRRGWRRRRRRRCRWSRSFY
jgi:hypothetical protein